MKDPDKADLDGDGEFDAIDLMILEDGEQEKKNTPRQNTGCCVLLLAVGSAVLGVSVGVVSVIIT